MKLGEDYSGIALPPAIASACLLRTLFIAN